MSDVYDRPIEEVVARFRRSSQNPPQWSEPSDGAWESIASALDFSQPGDAPALDFSQPKAMPAALQDAPGGFSRRMLFAGIGGFVVGAGLGMAGLRVAQTVGSTNPVKRAVLTPLDREDEKLGIAELRPLDVGYSLSVDVPKGAENVGGYVEVWLINVDLKRMISVGVFAAGTAAQFFVSNDLVDAGYLIVDLSNEEFDREPRHSGDTIMRGQLLS